MSAKEKRVLEEQLQRERLQADQLRSGLSEIENKMRANRQRVKEKENHCAALEEVCTISFTITTHTLEQQLFPVVLLFFPRQCAGNQNS